MKDLKDYLHLYIGTTCQFKEAKTSSMFTRKLEPSDLDHFFQEGYYLFIKPVLRPLSDMTLGEKGWIADLYSGMVPDPYIADRMNAARETKYMLARGLDVFNLIASESAIDKSKL